MTRSVALTLSLQLLTQLLTLGFGLACLRVARAARAPERAPGWFVTGATFTVLGVHAVVQCTWAIAAVARGKGSAVYEAYMGLLQEMNDARGVVVFGYAAALLAILSARRPFPARPGPVYGALLALLAVGTAVGALEGGFDRPGHYGVIAVMGTLTLVLLLTALYRALTTGAFDYLLWIAMSIYAIREALAANIFSVLGVENAWRPHGRTVSLLASASLVLMIACSLHRLRLLRAGLDAPDLMSRLRG